MSTWQDDLATGCCLNLRGQKQNKRDHCSFNSPVARLKASATLGFVAGGYKQPWHAGERKRKRQKNGKSTREKKCEMDTK